MQTALKFAGLCCPMAYQSISHGLKTMITFFFAMCSWFSDVVTSSMGALNLHRLCSNNLISESVIFK